MRSAADARARPRSRAPVLLAGAAALLALLAVADSGASAPSGAAATARSGPPTAQPSAEKRCKTVRVKLKRNGRVVKRNGKPVFRRVRRCKKVPSPGCRFVKVKKRTKSGKVVRRHGKPVYKRVERCPPKPTPPAPGPTPEPGPAPTPGPGATPGPGPAPQPGSAEELANRTMVLDPRVPGNINLFTSVFDLTTDVDGYYPQGSAMAPATGPVPTEDEARAQLAAYLSQWFEGDSARVDEALALFDADDVKALIADPTLRAAFAALKGTVLEPTIDHLLTSGLFTDVRWGGVSNPTAVAQVTGTTIIFNRRYQSEHFAYQIGTIGHEILHDDNPVNGAEEAIATALTAITEMQVLSNSPQLARGGTELARQKNTFALLFINSREAGSPNSEIYAPTGLGTAPGSAMSTPDLWTAMAGGGSSPAPQPLRTILQNVLVAGTPIPDPLNFEQATAELFANLGDNWLSDVERAQISVLLQLVTVDEIAQATGLPQQQVIDTLGLQPYLDAIGG